MKLRFLVIAAAALLMAFPAWAIDLQEARAAGLVGEKTDGYVAVLQETPDALALAKDVNLKRRQEYLRISQENGQPVDVVAKLAAQKIIGKLDPGSYYQDGEGEWQVKPDPR